MSLTGKECVPCRGGVEPLSEIQAKVIQQQTPDWRLAENATRLERNFQFADFVTAQAFVNHVGDLAEQENHHPDFSFGWGYVHITIYTHTIKGLHENDFILAAKIDEFIQGDL
jgi:4a-hydroxytetrahydrobiopterin dehydratase